jgi:hypothetical protein
METGHSQFSSYDQKLISILEILSAHFVDIYYNHIYISAQTQQPPEGSLTDEYVRQIRAYVLGVKSDKYNYQDVVKHLHKYFQSMTRFKTLTFTDFVERIVHNFVPPEYYDLYKTEEKDEILGGIVTDLISELGVFVTTPAMLRRVIDQHNQMYKVSIRILQDRGIWILLNKREEIRNLFLRRVGQTKDSVSQDVVENIKKVVRQLAKDKTDLQLRLRAAEDQVRAHESKIAASKRREAQLTKLIQHLQAAKDLGQPAAAFAATVPPKNTLAEYDPMIKATEISHPNDSFAAWRTSNAQNFDSLEAPEHTDLAAEDDSDLSAEDDSGLSAEDDSGPTAAEDDLGPTAAVDDSGLAAAEVDSGLAAVGDSGFAAAVVDSGLTATRPTHRRRKEAVAAPPEAPSS